MVQDRSDCCGALGATWMQIFGHMNCREKFARGKWILSGKIRNGVEQVASLVQRVKRAVCEVEIAKGDHGSTEGAIKEEIATPSSNSRISYIWLPFPVGIFTDTLSTL